MSAIRRRRSWSGSPCRPVYSSQPFETPTPEQLSKLASEIGLDLTDDESDAFLGLIAGSIGAEILGVDHRVLDVLVDQPLDVEQERVVEQPAPLGGEPADPDRDRVLRRADPGP